MRLRTGHKPEDWTTNVPAEPLSGQSWFRGSLLDTEPSHAPVNEARRRQLAEAQRRLRAKKAQG